MGILHVVDSPQALQACLPRLCAGDGVILINDAAGLLVDTVPSDVSFYRLDQQGVGCEPVIDMAGFVTLTVRYARVISWA